MRPSLDNTRAMFRQMATDGWNIAGPLKFGFLFIHPTVVPLRDVSMRLSQRGLTIDYLKADGTGTWGLHAHEVALHTPDSLHARDQELADLAGELGIQLYDGWSVNRP